ncbi:MAG: ABC transporter transmembrane domain-containing protein [Acidobacteriota bacterium]
MPDFRRLILTLKPHRGSLAVAAAALTGVSAATVMLAALLRPLFDRALSPGELENGSWKLPVTLIGLYAIKGIFAFTSVYLLSRTAHRVAAGIRQQAFAALQGHGASFMERHHSGSLVSRLTADAEVLHALLSEHLASLCRDSLMVLGLMAWIFYLNPLLAMLSLVVAPAVVWPTVRIGKRLRQVAQVARQRLANLAVRTQESVTGARVVRAFGLQRHLEEGFRVENENLSRDRLEAARSLAFASPFMEFLGAIAAALVFVVSARALEAGTMTGGALLSFLTALFLQYTPVKRLSHVHSQIQQGLAASARLFELIDTPGENSMWPGRGQLVRARGALEFRGVRVWRGGRAILDGVNLCIQPGERIAIAGASGAGKTTLLSLLLGFVEPDEGGILLDGVDVRDLSLQSLRAQFSVVAQETMLFAGTLSDNVHCARSGASELEVRAAMRAAQLDDLLRRLRDGVHTRLGEGGAPLSAGERQRVAVARAVLKDAPIVLLDEATSNLDRRTEQRLFVALRKLMRGRTVLIVSHHSTGMSLAERYVTLEQGKIREGRNMDIESPLHPYSQPDVGRDTTLSATSGAGEKPAVLDQIRLRAGREGRL